MTIEAQYTYEKSWRATKDEHLLQIIVEEVGDADPQGTLAYIKEAIKNGKMITVGGCRFRRKEENEKNIAK